MATNYVSIAVRAQDGAKPDLEALKARLAELNKQVATARADVDDADADAKLTDLQAKLAAIDKKVASPKIDVAGASRALAQLTAVDAAMRRLGGQGEPEGDQAGGGFARAFLGRMDGLRSKVDGGVLGQGGAGKAGASDGGVFGNSFVQTFLGGKKSVIVSGISSLMATMPALGAVGGVGLMAGLGAMVANQIPAVHAQFAKLGTTVMSTLETAVKPMIPFLTSAVTQIGGFVKSIGPELSGLFRNVGPMIMPLAKGLEGLVGGLLPGLSAIIKSAMPAVTAFGSVLGSLGKDLGGMLSAMAPAVAASAGVMKALFDAVGGLLPVIGKLAAVMAGALAPILVQVAGAVKALSPAFTAIGKIVAEFAGALLVNLSGGLTAVIGLVKVIAPAIGVLAGALGQAFNLMNNRGVLNDLEDAFEALVGPIGTLITALVSGLVPVLPAVMNLATALADAFQAGLVSAVTALVPAVVSLVPVLSKVAVIIADVLATGVMALTPLLVKLAPTILAIVGAMKLWSIATGILNVVMAANPLGLVIIAIAALVGLIVELVRHWHAVAAVFDTVRHAIAASVDAVVKFVETHWKLLAVILGTLLLGPIAGLVIFIATHWKQITALTARLYSDVTGFFSRIWKDVTGFALRIDNDVTGFFSRMWHDVTSAVSRLYHDVIGWVERLWDGFTSRVSSGVANIVSFFKGLPGRIMGAIGDLSGMLYKAGVQAIKGLISGVGSMVASGVSTLEGWGHDLASAITHPFGIHLSEPSEAAIMIKAGKNVPLGLAKGIRAGMPDMSSTMARVAGMVAGRPGGAGGYGAGGAAGRQQLEVTLIMRGEMLKLLQTTVRQAGGDPLMFQRKVAYR